MNDTDLLLVLDPHDAARKSIKQHVCIPRTRTKGLLRACGGVLAQLFCESSA